MLMLTYRKVYKTFGLVRNQLRLIIILYLRASRKLKVVYSTVFRLQSGLQQTIAKLTNENQG